jgi:hypothetical protein
LVILLLMIGVKSLRVTGGSAPSFSPDTHNLELGPNHGGVKLLWITRRIRQFCAAAAGFLETLLTIRTKHEHHTKIKRGRRVMDKFMDGVAQGMGWAMAMSLMLFAIHAVPLMLR